MPRQSHAISITAKRQATFPKRVLEAMGLKPGDRVELLESAEGYLLRPYRVDRSKLGTLRAKLKPASAPFNLEVFREQTYDPALRD